MAITVTQSKVGYPKWGTVDVDHPLISSIQLFSEADQTVPELLLYLGNRQTLDEIVERNGPRAGSPEEMRYYETTKCEVFAKLDAAGVPVEVPSNYFVVRGNASRMEDVLRALDFDDASIDTIKGFVQRGIEHAQASGTEHADGTIRARQDPAAIRS